MGFFKPSVTWSSKKKRKVLTRNRDSSEAGFVQPSQDHHHPSTASIDASKPGQGLSPQPNITNDRIIASTQRLSVPLRLAETSNEEQGYSDITAESLHDETIIDLSATSTPSVKRRERREPLFADIPSNYSKPDLISPEEVRMSSLPAELWSLIASFLDPTGAASLAHASKTLRYRLGSEPWKALNQVENHKYRVDFLSAIDKKVPSHLFCFLCASYHIRTQPGKERLQAKYTNNPVFLCPNARTLALPRMRLTHGSELPFAYVQLATRSTRHTPEHGIPLTSLLRRWRCSDSEWSHAVRFHLHDNGHLLMRCSSTSYVKPRLQPNEERLLLYSRSDYAPYFSVCSHWANGNLMPLCKCALSHIPAPVESVVDQLRKGPRVEFKKLHTNIMPKMCDECKPLRRCRECPSEYMITLKLVEDKRDRIMPFKQAICITRWSDLGDGTSPLTPEWAAGTGQHQFDSLKAIGNASLCSIFEAAVSKGAPSQQMQWLSVHRDTHQDVY